MKFYKTGLLGLAAAVVLGGVYYWTVIKEKKDSESTDIANKIVYLKKDQINYLEIQNKTQKFVFQKNENGWSIQEPITDGADDQIIDEVLDQLTNEKQVAVAKEGVDIKWSEFGLDNPDAGIIFKNNLGQSQKISLSATKNFEGNNYARIDNNQKILVVNPVWFNFTTEKLVYFRNKSLYRGQMVAIKKISIKSLSDKFSLVKEDQKWTPVGESYSLDQNKVRSMIKTIAENSIQDYINEGDPSDVDKKAKGLAKDFVQITFETDTSKWSVILNQTDKFLYALTEKPTYLVKLDLSQWQFFGNLNLDALRDRKTSMTFDIGQVAKIFVKSGKHNFHFLKTGDIWKTVDDSSEKGAIDSDAINKIISQVHDLEITYFIPENEGKEFTGKEMIILKSSEDQLLFQLNWGPLQHKKVSGLEKDYFLARTQESDNIFGLNKSYIDNLPFDQIFQTKAKPETKGPSDDQH